MPSSLIDHLREQLIAAELADDLARAAEIREELNRLAAPSVRETR